MGNSPIGLLIVSSVMKPLFGFCGCGSSSCPRPESYPERSVLPEGLSGRRAGA